jgi:hypothetical protein
LCRKNLERASQIIKGTEKGELLLGDVPIRKQVPHPGHFLSDSDNFLELSIVLLSLPEVDHVVLLANVFKACLKQCFEVFRFFGNFDSEFVGLVFE